MIVFGDIGGQAIFYMATWVQIACLYIRRVRCAWDGRDVISSTTCTILRADERTLTRPQDFNDFNLLKSVG